MFVPVWMKLGLVLKHFFILFIYEFITCSLRVNLDMGKCAYGWMIMKDENIPGTVVRTSTIPEELGRLVYLLTDKTGRSHISALLSFLDIVSRSFGLNQVESLDFDLKAV